MNDFYRPVDPRPPRTCGECPFLRVCGGADGEAYERGCFQRCVEHCQFHFCDLACPCLHLRFADLIEDVGGLCTPPQRPIKPCEAPLPLYVTQINHGSSRDIPLDEPIVALPLTALVGKDQSGRYGVRFSSAESMREALKLSPGTDVIVTSVGYDQPLEDFWAEHLKRKILHQLAALNICAMTVPNFSFMLDVPRINSLYNLTRMYRVAERMSDAGIPTIFHLQASTRADWNRWVEVLRSQPEANCVALEFQTGAKRQKVGNRYYAGLVRLQDELGRSLHPLLVGGSGRVRDLARHFNRFTVVDCTPFMKTVYRQELLSARSGGVDSRQCLSAKGESLSSLLTKNIHTRRSRLAQKAEQVRLEIGARALLPPPNLSSEARRSALVKPNGLAG